jgi:glycyl-tRNA synthetase beta chain
MSQTRDLLIEIGCEELPPLALPRLSLSFEQGVLKGLQDLGFDKPAIKRFATPRRLGLLISSLPVRQQDQLIERRGPALQAAFDAKGQPTKAALGFAQSCSVDIAALEKLETDKGAWLVYKGTQEGKQTRDCIAAIVEKALNDLPIPKRMRWGDGDAEFVRPVHWLILLFGNEVIDAQILGVRSGNKTRGHRFLHNMGGTGEIAIKTPDAYEDTLFRSGKVIADFGKRREKIKQQVLDAAKQLRGVIQIENDEELLDEVTALVEWPVPIVCDFEEKFLHVPAEALVSTMKGNQKYFPVYDTKGSLTRHFIAISNLESRDPSKIREGNQRVVRPRLADAEFFWNQGKKQPLESYNEKLKTVVFQNKLGTVYEKAQRVSALAAEIAKLTNTDAQHAARAGILCKADLMTDMVFEFPKLQGTMGRYYAISSGEPEVVAIAIEEHYLPRFAGDQLPKTACGQNVALADKLDTLIGIFAAGQKPSGEKDPFALRRAALGVLKIIIDKRLPLDLYKLLELAAKAMPVDAAGVVNEVFDFIMARLRADYEGRQQDGFTPQQVEAVMTCRPTRPLDFDMRIRAVKTFSTLPEAESLAAANKRIANLLKKTEATTNSKVDPELLQEPAEKALDASIRKILPEVEPLYAAGDYETALKKLAGLRQPVDTFFDAVMVMADDKKLRQNRLALLQQLSNLFTRIADISCLQNS